MTFRALLFLAFATAVFCQPVVLHAEIVSATLQAPAPAESGYFHLGTTRNPGGHELGVNSRCLLLDGQPWFPVMGEIHYSRVPAAEWRQELRKIKDGGVDIVATYVFWIHHEEIEGQWDWSGQRDLKTFLQTCNELGLKAVVRCGPWCHGEVRNGGLPDWVVAHKDWKLRSTDTNFLAATKALYRQIAEQLRGELWKDGGPVIGIQVDNEFGGAPEYLLALKTIAVDAGIDVPFYIKTGWPAMRKPVPLGELLPLFGAYADGFWEHSLAPMPKNNWENFAFKFTRTDTGVGDDQLGARTAGDTVGTEKYPYLTCEIGGGMPASYHRRMNYDPRDVEAVALCQLGSGSSLMGYYMYHGGQNPGGKLSTLQESQATGYPNDLPIKNYDFNAPIGEYGQLNPQYFWLRRLHRFLHAFGPALAPMPLTLPEVRPHGKDDIATLRWAVRSDGLSGFVFVNNYQRLQPMPPKPDIQFKLKLCDSELIFPKQPTTIPADAFFVWPFNLNLDEARLVYATAQPIGKARSGSTDIFYFAETPGVAAEFAFDLQTLESKNSVFQNVKPSRHPFVRLKTKGGKAVELVLLSDADSLAMRPFAEGAKASFEPVQVSKSVKVTAVPVRPSGLRGPVSLGKGGVAMAPGEAEFAQAAVWKLQLPARKKWSDSARLRIRYVGDIARVTLNGRLLDDDLYSGRDFELGLQRYGAEIVKGDLQLEILPLPKAAPIYFEPRAKPDFGASDRLAELKAVEIVD
ncbi:MAG TPA: beta-galactosidase [Verrucomicrobiae bacterium]